MRPDSNEDVPEMKKLFVLPVLLACFSLAFAQDRVRLATTTSTNDSGLLAALNPAFEEQTGIKVDVIAVGSGKALELGRNGDVDVLLTHDPAAEEKFIKEGAGVERKPVMENDFVIVGPAADPAGVRKASSAAGAVSRIAAASAWFVSRGDKSGTHVKEQELFKAAGVDTRSAWYLAAGQGMGPVLQMAAQKQAYTLADRGTWLAQRSKLELVLLHEGDASLRNPYHVTVVNPARNPGVRAEQARAYGAFLIGPEGQRLIGDFKVDGEVLFKPVAGEAGSPAR